MAGNTIDINLSVQDQGKTIQGRTNDAKRLNEQLERAQNLMRGNRSSMQGRRAGFGGIEGGEVETYNRARGASGAGGASARDFADQARGLGGLVRLYATWAANLFAVSAAFNALRESMATEMMIRGLDQLGAATGQAMGGIAKNFANASDGAISLREAMEATAKAMTSGLSESQLMDLGKVAKGASQALGISMTDAVSRLTRGITKLEPELLDELGLFTKVGKASEDYARSIGKAESQLTDFERRQAFANAVLKEGKDKFGEIAQSANPYDKLLAELKNTAQNILSVVNAFITPIAKLLADNTQLIGAALAFAALKLTKQALPELGRWREGLKQSADIAKEKAAEINENFQAAFGEKQAKILGIPNIEKEITDAKTRLKKAQQELSQAARADGVDKRVTGSKWFGAATQEEELSSRSISKLNELNAKYAGDEAANKRQVAEAAKKIVAEQELINRKTVELTNLDEKLQDGLQTRSKLLSGLWQREQILLDARRKAEDLDIRSKVGKNVDEKGLGAAIGELYSEATASKTLGTFGKIKTVGVGTFQAIFRAAEILASSLARFANVVGIIYVAFEILDSFLSTNTKQVKEYKSSIDQLEEATKNASLTAEKYKNSLSVEAIIAYANSFDNLTKKVSEANERLKEAERESSTWDKILDKLADWTPGLDSLRERAGNSLAKSIVESIKLAPEGEARKQLEEKYRNILGLDKKLPLNVKNIASLLDSIGDAKFDATFDAIDQAMQDTNKTFGDSSKILSSLKDSADQLTKAYQNLANSVTDKSPLNEFLISNIKLNQELANALTGGNDLTKIGAASFIDKIESIQGLDPKLLQDFGKVAIEFEELNKRAESYRKSIYEADAKLKELPEAREKLTKQQRERGGFAGDISAGGRLADPNEKLRSQLQTTIETARSGLDILTPKIAGLQKELADIIESNTKNAVDSFLKKSSLEMKKLKLQAQQIILEVVPEAKTVSTIQERMRLEKAQINVDKQLQNLTFEQLLSQQKNTIALELLRSELELARLREEQKSGNVEEDVAAQREIKIKEGMAVNEQILTALEGGSKGIADLLKSDKSNLFKGKLTGLFNILSAKDRNEQEAFNKELSSNLKGRLEQIELIYSEKIKSLRDTYESISTATNILVTGPEAELFKDSLNLVANRLKDQENILQFDKTLEQLQEKLKDAQTKGGPGSEGTIAATQDEIDLIKGRKDRAKQLDEERRAIEATNLAQKAKIVPLQRELELQQLLSEAIKSRVTGTTAAAERERIEADRSVRSLQLQLSRVGRELEISRAEELAAKAQAELNKIDPAEFDGAGPEQQARIKSLRAQVELGQKLPGIYKAITGAEKTAESGRRIGEDVNLQVKEIQDQIGLLQAESSLQQTIADITTQRLQAELDLRGRLLERGYQGYAITNEQYILEKRTLEQRRIQDTLDKQLAQNLRDQAIARQELNAAQIQEQTEEGADDFRGLGVQPNVAIETRKARIKILEQQRQGYIDAAEASKRLLDIEMYAFTREGEYTKAFESAFGRMTDAILEFTKTGKLNFKDMINSFLADLLRIETQRAFRMLFSTAGGAEGMAGTLISGVKTIFGAANGGVTGTMTIPGYAMGGIVNRPTLLQTYAKGGTSPGLAMVGEGNLNEAIVPLPDNRSIPVKFTNNMANSGGSVEIVVNNYGKEQATAKETTDGRGNRRIEVTVGDMVAGELGRTNSSLQKSFTNTYGLSSMVGRR